LLIDFHFFLLDRLRIKRMTFRCEAAPCGQFKLPAMHRACQDTVLDMSKASEICFQVRATALDAVTVAFPELLNCRLFSIVALGILQAFWREAFEEIVNVLVICTFALCLEAAGEEDLVDPVFLVMNDAIFEKSRVNVEAIIPLLASLAPR
jgi:hypothetical protein